MPKVAQHKWVSNANALDKLDDHVNEPANRAAFHQDLLTSATPGFDAGGPFGEDAATQAHWTTDWIDADGHGGTYWPYATHVDFADMLKQGLTRSVQEVIDTGKVHNTLWVVTGETPAEYAQGKPVTKAEQEKLFKVAVHATNRVINLVIMTPPPV
jgi:hypothetical protein